jgi:hypothetical protein
LAKCSSRAASQNFLYVNPITFILTEKRITKSALDSIELIRGDDQPDPGDWIIRAWLHVIEILNLIIGTMEQV